MSWLTNFVRPKIRALVGEKKDVPDNLWDKCPGCGAMLFRSELAENHNVCRHCGYHLKLGVDARLKLLFDDGKWQKIDVPKVPVDPLKFRDQKKYADRLRDAQNKSGRQDAIVVAEGTMGGHKTIIAAFDFSFMGGSMGMGVGEGLVTAAQRAVASNAAFIAIPASGGARMQEGALSLMQMPRSIIAVEQVKQAGLPYIVIFTDPTTGGVTASFAMVGDLHIAEKGAMIGFAGARVIENTIRETLPPGFQRAEYLLEHGMVDIVVTRTELRETLIRVLGLLGKNQKSTKDRQLPAPKGKTAALKGEVLMPGPHGAPPQKQRW
jgi:acetyl-CoA carboxylase carboxyl transferase subunit beta